MDAREVVSRAARAVKPRVAERSHTLLVETPPDALFASWELRKVWP
jgi:hypothetical protein